MDFLSDNLMRCVPTCPTWHRYFSSFLSWLNLTPAEHADWIKLPRQTVPPPPQISDLISSVFLSFSKEINGVRHPSVDTSEPQRRRHSSSNNKTFTLDNTSFTEKVFPYSAKKKKKKKTNKPESCLKPGRRIILCICDCSFLGCFDNRVRKIILVMKWWPSQRT